MLSVKSLTEYSFDLLSQQSVLLTILMINQLQLQKNPFLINEKLTTSTYSLATS